MKYGRKNPRSADAGRKLSAPAPRLEKTPTYICGLDDKLEGGVPLIGSLEDEAQLLAALGLSDGGPRP